MSKRSKYIARHSGIRAVDDLTFTSRDEEGRICWWDVILPKTNYWSVHEQLGRAYAFELIDLINNDGKSEDLGEHTFGSIASEIARQRHTVTDGIYIGFFNVISEQLITGDVDR